MDNGVGILRALPSDAPGINKYRPIAGKVITGFHLNTSFPFYSKDIETVQPGGF